VSERDDQSVAGAEEAAKSPTIGLLLRKAREARGLTVADVVSALKYSPRQIEALEANDMPLASGNVFLRGFIRSYARFLKLDPEPLLALLEAENPVTPLDVVPPEDMGVAMPRSGGHQVSGLVAAAILITVLAAAIGVWHFMAPPSAPAPSVTSTVPETVPAAHPVASTAVGPEQNLTTASAAPSDAKQPMVVPVAPPELAVPDEHHERADRAAQTDAGQPAADAGKTLIFQFGGTCWVEVKDASQRVIFTGEYVGGTKQAISGQPPFDIVIGNAPLVDLMFDGRRIDLKPYTKAEVARLTLD